MEFYEKLAALVASVVTIVGLPIAVLSLLATLRGSQRAADAQLVTTLSLRFQEKWEKDWRDLTESGRPLDDSMSRLEKNQFYDLLNWIDWLGVMIDRKLFSHPALILRSIERPLRSALRLAKDEVNKDGASEWPGVFIVAARLDCIDGNGQIAIQ